MVTVVEKRSKKRKLEAEGESYSVDQGVRMRSGGLGEQWHCVDRYRSLISSATADSEKLETEVGLLLVCIRRTHYT